MVRLNVRVRLEVFWQDLYTSGVYTHLYTYRGHMRHVPMSHDMFQCHMTCSSTSSAETMLFFGGQEHLLERNGSGVELWTLDHENPGSNPVLQC